MRTALVLTGAGIAAGCAMTYDVVKIGNDTYQTSAVAAPVRGGISGAQQMALTNANKKCDSIGKSINVTNIESGHEFPANGRSHRDVHVQVGDRAVPASK
jgi:hypothetical protein